MPAFRLIADVAEDAIRDRHHFRSLPREDVDSLMHPAAAIARVVPRIAQIARLDPDYRHAERDRSDRREKRAGAIRELFVADLGGGSAGRNGRFAYHLTTV